MVTFVFSVLGIVIVSVKISNTRFKIMQNIFDVQVTPAALTTRTKTMLNYNSNKDKRTGDVYR